MTIHQKHIAAKEYYKTNRIRWREEYILTDGIETKFVDKDYEPGNNEAVFYCYKKEHSLSRTIDIKCLLHKMGKIIQNV